MGAQGLHLQQWEEVSQFCRHIRTQDCSRLYLWAKGQREEEKEIHGEKNRKIKRLQIIY